MISLGSFELALLGLSGLWAQSSLGGGNATWWHQSALDPLSWPCWGCLVYGHRVHWVGGMLHGDISLPWILWAGPAGAVWSMGTEFIGWGECYMVTSVCLGSFELALLGLSGLWALSSLGGGNATWWQGNIIIKDFLQQMCVPLENSILVMGTSQSPKYTLFSKGTLICRMKSLIIMFLVCPIWFQDPILEMLSSNRGWHQLVQ